MVARLLVLFFVVVFPIKGAFSQPEVGTGAGDNHAEVVKHSGLISFYDRAGNRLSFENKSFLSFKIGNAIHTNNDSPPAGTQYFPVGSTTKQGDTITTVWQLASVKLTQLVYPSGGLGSKIVVRFVVENISAKPITIGSQYLLDIQLMSEDGVDVFDPRQGVGNKGSIITDSIPPHIGFAENSVPNAPTYDLGVITEALFDHPRISTKLPSLLVYTDWNTIERVSYVTESYQPTTFAVQDASLLMQWDSVSVAAGATIEIGSFLYGKTEIGTCRDKASAYIFTPIIMQPTEPAIEIPIYLGNYTNSTFTNIFVTLNASGAVMFADGTKQAQRSIGTLASGRSAGLIASLIVDPASSSDEGTITISATSPQDQELLKSCPITIPIARGIDTHPPEIVKITRVGASDTCTTKTDLIVIHDDADPLDAGVAAVTFIDTTNYRIRYRSGLSAPPDSLTYELAVIDSMKDAFAIIVAKDAQQLVSRDTISYCTTLDTLAPRIQFELSSNRWIMRIFEDRPWDRLVDSVRITNAVNVLVQQNGVRGTPSIEIYVRSADGTLPSSFCISAIDLAGNSTVDTCLSIVASAVNHGEAPTDIRIYPNPATDRITIESDDDLTRQASIHDHAGKLVWAGVLASGLSSIETSHFASGAYTLVVTMSSEPRAIPFRIER